MTNKRQSMKLLDYFWARALVTITGIVFLSQLIIEISGPVTRKPGFEWVIYVCGAAFGAAMLYAIALVLLNAWIKRREFDI
jgi:hypothetical protein